MIATPSASSARQSSTGSTPPSNAFSTGASPRSTRPSWTASTTSRSEDSGTPSTSGAAAVSASSLTVPGGPRYAALNLVLREDDRAALAGQREPHGLLLLRRERLLAAAAVDLLAV